MYKFYSFTTRKGKVKSIVEYNITNPNNANTLDYGKPGHSHLVCAKDEFDAYKIVNRWLHLGKPLPIVPEQGNAGSAGIWKYEEQS